LNSESTQAVKSFSEPVYPWFQVAFEIAQEKTGWSEDELTSTYATLANVTKDGDAEAQALSSAVFSVLATLDPELNQTSDHLSEYSRKVMQTELATAIATGLLTGKLRGYSRDGSLICQVQRQGLFNPARKVFVRPSQVNQFLTGLGHNFQWNPIDIEIRAVGTVDPQKSVSGGLGQNPDGVETSDIAFAFKGVVHSEASWKKILAKPPQWLLFSRRVKGRRGGLHREARWDPIAFGIAVKTKYEIPLNRIRARFQTIPALKPWHDRWKEAEATYYPDE